MILPVPAQRFERPISVSRYADSSIPTARGRLRFIVYRAELGGTSTLTPSDGESRGGPLARWPVDREHIAIVAGEAPLPGEGVLVRVHSECLTSEVFGSLKCDCREQLDLALDRIVEEGAGVLVYLRQEGRGIGLGNKIRAYALQERGADTIEANHQLGFATDERSYDVAAAMLTDLGIRSVRLITNNPDKVESLERSGVAVVERVPVLVPPNLHSAGYLRAKRERLGHFLGSAAPSDPGPEAE